MSPTRTGKPFWQVLLLGALFLAGIGLSTPALAGQNLAGEFPDGHDSLIVVDFNQLRNSPFFARAMAWVRSQPEVESQLRDMEREFSIDVETDIEVFALLSDTPPLNPDMLTDPMGALSQGLATAESDGSTIFIRGNIEGAELLARLNEGQAARHARTPDMDVHLIDDRTLALVSGPNTYRDEIRTKLQNSSGPGAVFTQAFATFGSAQGVYLMSAPELDAELRDELGASASFAAVGLQMASDVRLAVLLTMESEESAAQSAMDFESLRGEALANPLVSLFGLGPLVNNMAIRQEGPAIQLRTSMTNAEADRLLTRALRIMATAQDMQTPLGGDDDSSTREAPPEVPRDGVDADFN